MSIARTFVDAEDMEEEAPPGLEAFAVFGGSTPMGCFEGTFEIGDKALLWIGRRPRRS
jgi:hypothetical protein